MEKNRFSRLNRRTWGVAAVSAAFLVPLGVFGAPALAKSAASEYEYGGSGQYQYKVLLCHHTHSKKHRWHQIRVGAPAVKAHLKHGDTLGACPTTAAPAASPSKKSGSDKHGKSGDHGNGNNGSNDNSATNPSNGKSGDDHGNNGSNGNGHGKGK